MERKEYNMNEYIICLPNEHTVVIEEENAVFYCEPIDELIRCKDCKHCRTYYHGENMPFSYACDRLYLTNNLSNTDYCSRAERKEENND